MVPLPDDVLSLSSMYGSRKATAAFMTSADCSTNKLHLAGPEQLADRLHPGQQRVVDDVESADAAAECLLEVGIQPIASTIDDAPLEPLEQRQGKQLRLAGGSRLDPVTPSKSSR